MNVESVCRYGEIYYGCYNMENSYRNMFKEEGGIGSRSHCLLEEACTSSAISLIDAGGNDKTLRVRGGGVGMRWHW